MPLQSGKGAGVTPVDLSDLVKGDFPGLMVEGEPLRYAKRMRYAGGNGCRGRQPSTFKN